MSMFRSAATKIAHNSTIPALGGNRDLRPLQDLILAEKQVLISLQRLSTDFAKAAEALRIWGLGEGEDLGDILGASTNLLTLWSNALSQYATHGHAMRDYLKSIRTREENLDDLKRRRKAVWSKAESVEKKLSKMGPEHKNLTMQTDSLNALRAEIRNMDSEIMTEEAALGDFKRSTTKAWVGLKFGGLLECTEKGIIAGEFGKLVITEIQEEHTQPGMSRSLYYGRAKTEQLLSEAHRCISEVIMSTVPSERTRTSYPQHTPQPLPQNPFGTPQSGFQSLGMQHSGASHGLGVQHTGGQPQTERSPDIPPVVYLPAQEGLGAGEFFNQPGSPTAGPVSPTLPNFSQYPQIQSEPQSQASPRSVDDFGVGVNGPIDQPGPTSGGRFATFPVKNRPSGLAGYALSDTPVRPESDSFTASVAQALSSSQVPPANAQQPQRGLGGRLDASYEVSHAPTYSPPPGPPPGAAMQPPVGWSTRLQHEERPASDEEGGLAYMSNPDDDAASRHVRFGAVNDIDSEIGRRGRPDSDDTSTSQQRYQQENPPSPLQQQHSYQEQKEEEIQPEGQPPQYQVIPPTIETARPSLELSQASQVGAVAPGDTTPTTDARFQNQRRVPPPSVDPSEDDERALNAAAAREISRELDALAKFGTPPVSPPISPDNPSTHDRQPSLSLGHGPSQIDNSPLAPPSAPFSRQTPSPHADADSPTLPYPSPVQYSYTQAPTQHPQQPPAPQHYAQRSVQYQQQPPSTHYGQELAQNQQRPSSPAYHTQESAQYQQQPPPLGNNEASTGTPRNGSVASIKDELPRHPPVATRFSPSLPSQPPLEYPSRSPLNAQVPPGTRTISAAAFRRPQRMASGDLPSLADPSPLLVKKRLPSSPYPQQREASPNRHGRSGSPAQAPAPAQNQALPPIPTQDDNYDYLSAYVDAGAPSDAPGDIHNYDQPIAGNVIRGQGYREGRFATDLEGSLR